MKTIVCILMFLFASVCFGQAKLYINPNGDGGSGAVGSSPFPPPINNRFRNIERLVGDNHEYDHLIRVRYNVVNQGGTSGTTIGLQGYLPVGAVVTEVDMYFDTMFSASTLAVANGALSGQPAIQFQCGSTSNILIPKVTYSSTFASGTIFHDIGYASAVGSSYVAAGNINGTSACQIQAVLSQASNTAGKLTVFIHYIVHD